MASTRQAKLTAFNATFGAHLSGTVRWPALLFIVDELLKLERPVSIFETGTTREPGNWAGDGNTTAVWGWLAKRTGGSAISVDVDAKACETARKLHTGARILEGDSLDLLGGVTDRHRIDLLYLDAYDWTPTTAARAALHAAGELARAWDVLPSGCLIAADDCHSITQGRHCLIDHFFHALGVVASLEGYVYVWRKP